MPRINLCIFTRRTSGMSIAEFAPILFIFVLLLFPLINFIALGCGAATAYMMTRQASITAATAINFPAATSGVVQDMNSWLASGLSKFAKLKPVKGLQGSGINLFIAVTDPGGDVVHNYGPNTPVPPPIDVVNKVYEYEARGTFDVGPFMDLSGLPFVGTFPGIGVPVRMSYTNSRAAEHPEGLSGLAALAAYGGGGQMFQPNGPNGPSFVVTGLPDPINPNGPQTPQLVALVPYTDSNGNVSYYIVHMQLFNNAFGNGQGNFYTKLPQWGDRSTYGGTYCPVAIPGGVGDAFYFEATNLNPSSSMSLNTNINNNGTVGANQGSMNGPANNVNFSEVFLTSGSRMSDANSVQLIENCIAQYHSGAQYQALHDSLVFFQQWAQQNGF